MIDANFFALLVVIQVACCFVVALYSNVILKKLYILHYLVLV